MRYDMLSPISSNNDSIADISDKPLQYIPMLLAV
jgi:hypothetical protein